MFESAKCNVKYEPLILQSISNWSCILGELKTSIVIFTPQNFPKGNKLFDDNFNTFTCILEIPKLFIEE